MLMTWHFVIVGLRARWCLHWSGDSWRRLAWGSGGGLELCREDDQIGVGVGPVCWDGGAVGQKDERAIDCVLHVRFLKVLLFILTFSDRCKRFCGLLWA